MKRLLLCLPLLASIVLAQGPSQGDRDHTISAMHASRKQFLDTVGSLSEAQLKWKAAPESWSVLEVAEHLVLLEDLVPTFVKAALAKPAEPEKKPANPRAHDVELLKALADRSKKATSPEPGQPKGRYTNGPAVMAAFRASRDRNIAYVRETSDDLRYHFVKHPLFGDLDGLAWYVLLAGHAERHVMQMREVVANPGFPKK